MRRCHKIGALLIACCLLVALLSGCMSEEEKEKGKQQVLAAQPKVEQYLKDQYGGGKITQIGFLEEVKESSAIPDFGRYVSSYVMADVVVDGQAFQVLMNTEEEKFYDNRWGAKLYAQLKQYIVGRLPAVPPQEVMVRFYPLEIEGIQEKYFTGFTAPGVDTLEELLQEDQYAIYGMCNYVNGANVSFTPNTLESVFPQGNFSSLYIGLANFKSQERWEQTDRQGMLTDDFFYGGYADQQYAYCLEDFVFGRKGMTEQEIDGKWQDAYQKEPEYQEVHYQSAQVGELELAWNADVYDISFSTEKADPVIRTQYYSGDAFQAVWPEAVKLTINRKEDAPEVAGDRIYLYFDKDASPYYAYIQQDLTEDIKKLDWETEYYTWYWISNAFDASEITIGLYDKIETEEENT